MHSLTPVARALLFANVGIFALQALVGPVLVDLLALWPPASPNYRGMPSFQPWQLLSYGFLHGGLSHLFFNMFALYMFGPAIERQLGGRRFLVYYLACVIGAAVAQLMTGNPGGGPPVPTVGASGGVFGLLLAFGLFFPQQRIVLLFPPIPMPAWLFVTLYGCLELYLGVTGSARAAAGMDGPDIAHFAHLGGMVVGWLLLNHWRRQGRVA